MQLSYVLQSFYLLSAAAILAASSITSFQTRFVTYGSRAADASQNNGIQQNRNLKSGVYQPVPAHRQSSWLSRLLDLAASAKVPHAWFTHFYICSISSSLFWALQFLVNGHILNTIIQAETPRAQSQMTIEQVLLTWALMLAQGIRRLYECIAFQKPSNATMWVGHWLIGIGFYVAMGMSVWIEGTSSLQTGKLSFEDLVLMKAPTLRSFIGVTLFILASGMQHDCHAYLASLKQYTLPEHPLFKVVVCPHYSAECLIYLAIAIIAGPSGWLCNRTISCAFIFVGVNLGVTARNTKAWYAGKFRSERVMGRWRMIPYMY